MFNDGDQGGLSRGRANGKRRRLTAGDIDRVLAQVERSPGGTYRALASKALEGKPLGGFL
jgi:hypothetical protein